MFDGFLGACMGGELVHRWDASAAAGAPGMIAAAAGSICFVLFLRRLRPA
jgi:uncharacterized membrane protein YeaQ/YmgE (transglycosylase-associated protein family)